MLLSNVVASILSLDSLHPVSRQNLWMLKEMTIELQIVRNIGWRYHSVYNYGDD
jgi:hypothetical protein